MKLNISVLNIILVFVISLFFVEKSFSQTGCTNCKRTNPIGGQNTPLTITDGEVVCFTENREFGDLIVHGGTICIAEGIKLTINTNVTTTVDSTLNLEIYGILQFNQSTTLNATVNANIYSNGILRSGSTGGSDFTFAGSGNNYINNDGLMDMGVLNFSDSSGIYYFDNNGTMSITRNINIKAKTTKFKNNPGGTMNIGQNFGMNSGTAFYNCGTMTIGNGFNINKGHIINTNSFTVTGDINYGSNISRIDNYGTFNVNGNIQMASGAHFYNEGVTTITGGSFTNEGHIDGPESGLGKVGYIYFDVKAGLNNGSIGPNLNFKNTSAGGVSSFAGMFQNRANILINDSVSVSWDCEATDTCACAAPKQTILNLCPDFEGNFPRFWTGSSSEDFNIPSNWTTGIVPVDGEDVEFATAANNNNNPAQRDMRLPADESITIGTLMNETNLATIIPAGTSLTINNKLTGSDSDASKLVIESANDKPGGTLIFTNPAVNSNVKATIQFYNQAYECKDCGFYRRSWQYFGIPVNESEFPYNHVMGNETVNQWVEPYNGDKWQPAPYTPDTKLMAFRGYQITNDSQVLPKELYSFSGTLNVGDALVPLTRTESVNYPGVNLVANSYTAAIPISATALQFPTGVQETLYLFNTGTRDQWRKLNGTNIPGYKSGQYLAVPLKLGGQNEFPDKIPSTHAFMILTEGEGNLNINYSELTKNTKVNRGDGSQIVTRSVDSNSNTSVSEAPNAKQQLPSLVMDVIGEESADRVWIFQKEGTSHNFNNGWDGRKMLEDGIAQLYVNATDESKLQVATVPELDSLSLGFIADFDGKYTFEFAQKGKLKGTDIYLHDAVTGTTQQVGDGQSYSFTAKRGEAGNRFSLSSKDNSAFLSVDESLVEVSATSDGEIKIVNSSSRTVSAFVYDSNGVFLQQLEVKANDKTIIDSVEKGTYMVRLQNSHVNDVRRVTVE